MDFSTSQVNWHTGAIQISLLLLLLLLLLYTIPGTTHHLQNLFLVDWCHSTTYRINIVCTYHEIICAYNKILKKLANIYKYTNKKQNISLPFKIFYQYTYDAVFTHESSYCFQRILAIAILSVCLSVYLSHGWISQKRCKLGSPNRLPGRL